MAPADGIQIVQGNSSPPWTNVTVSDNKIRRLKSYQSPTHNSLGTAIQVVSGGDIKILNNDIDYEWEHTGLLGIRARGGAIIIEGNQIRNCEIETYPFANFIGISLDNNLGIRSTVMNNMISNFRKSVQGIYLQGSNIGVYHNSVCWRREHIIPGTPPCSFRGVWMWISIIIFSSPGML